jgi:uncharacterized repeat protein (TIGR03843 family)
MSGIERTSADNVIGSLDQALRILGSGTITVLGLLPYSSNYTFLARVELGDQEALAVYKPRRGERPLWDFPPGSLAAREVGAWLVSEASEWGIVPPTVLRDDAPLGEGSVQMFIKHDPDRHFFVLMEERLAELGVFAAFDAVVNNADRKGGHVLEDMNGRLWAVDHGLCFNDQPKLRTVIWQFAGERFGPIVRTGLEALRASLGEGPLKKGLSELLSDHEVAATEERVEALLKSGRWPAPRGDRPLPWPLV